MVPRKKRTIASSKYSCHTGQHSLIQVARSIRLITMNASGRKAFFGGVFGNLLSPLRDPSRHRKFGQVRVDVCGSAPVTKHTVVEGINKQPIPRLIAGVANFSNIYQILIAGVVEE